MGQIPKYSPLMVLGINQRGLLRFIWNWLGLGAQVVEVAGTLAMTPVVVLEVGVDLFVLSIARRLCLQPYQLPLQHNVMG